jgi:DNA-binding NtrC family response regulator
VPVGVHIKDRKKEPPPPAVTGKSVLIVEDDRLTCWGLEKMISSANLSVKCAASGKEAMDEIGRNLFHLILLDIHLPDGNALDLMKDIRVMLPDVKVIVMTGDDSEPMRRRAYEEGVLHFVPKPFDMREVRDLLNVCLFGGPQDEKGH